MRHVILFLLCTNVYADLNTIFNSVTEKYNLPDNLLKAICFKETRLKNVINWNDGKSPSYGHCQIKWIAAKQIGFKLTVAELNDAQNNIDVAGNYLAYLNKKCGSWTSAIAAYNAGRCLKNPLTNYAKDVILKWEDILNERNKSTNRSRSSSSSL